MKRSISVIYFFTLIFILNGCADSDDFNPVLFQHEMKLESLSYNGCDDTDPNCTYIKITYPKFISDTGVVEKISSVIMDMITEGEYTSPEEYCEAFIDEYDAFIKEDLGEEEYDLAWFSTTDVELLSIQKRAVSVSIEKDSFLGGAHNNRYVYLLNFDPASGKRFTYNDVFSQKSQEELLRLLESSLRNQYNLKKGESLNEAGFMLENDKLILSENFAFTDAGLLFIYNSYEIAPYSMGMIKIDLPYSRVMHLFE